MTGSRDWVLAKRNDQVLQRPKVNRTGFSFYTEKLFHLKAGRDFFNSTPYNEIKVLEEKGSEDTFSDIE